MSAEYEGLCCNRRVLGGFFLAPHSMSNLIGGFLLKSIVIGGLLLDPIIFGRSFVTLVTWFNDFYLSQSTLEDCLDRSSTW